MGKSLAVACWETFMNCWTVCLCSLSQKWRTSCLCRLWMTFRRVIHKQQSLYTIMEWSPVTGRGGQLQRHLNTTCCIRQDNTEENTFRWFPEMLDVSFSCFLEDVGVFFGGVQLPIVNSCCGQWVSSFLLPAVLAVLQLWMHFQCDLCVHVGSHLDH